MVHIAGSCIEFSHRRYSVVVSLGLPEQSIELHILRGLGLLNALVGSRSIAEMARSFAQVNVNGERAI
jgi:hypothetical protein